MTDRLDIEVADHRVQVLVDGHTGPVVMLCSGLGGRALHWSDTVADLAEDHTVVRFDRPGTPLTPLPELDVRRTVRGEADRIAAALDAVRPSDQAVVVGHSVGGFYAEGFARLYPQRTRALVLLDSSIAGKHRLRLALPLRPRLAAAKAVATLLNKLRLQAPLVHASLMLLQRRRPGGLDKPMLSEIRSAAAEPGLVVTLLTENAVYNSLAAELCILRKHRPLPPVPRLVVTAHTGWRTHHWRKQQIRLAKTLAAEHITISPAGHHVMIERPADTADLIRKIARAGTT